MANWISCPIVCCKNDACASGCQELARRAEAYTGSMPFLHIAKRFNVPYAVVMRICHRFDRFGHPLVGAHVELDEPYITEELLMAIADAEVTERARRRDVMRGKLR